MAGGKLSDIKATASDAVEILREIGTPGVQETFDEIREIAIIAKDVMALMQSPGWQENLENIRLISENFNQASERMERTTREIKETGIIDDAKGLVQTAREKIDSFGGNGNGEGTKGISSQDLREISVTVKEMFQSIGDLSKEVKAAIADSKNSGTIRNLGETANEVNETYETLQSR
jgi:hypothetical protein